LPSFNLNKFMTIFLLLSMVDPSELQV